MTRTINGCLWVLAWLACGYFAAKTQAEPASTLSKSGPWLVVESANFMVCAIADEATVRKLADDCEALRTTLQRQWLASGDAAAWQPKCFVVLHPTSASYLRDVGEAQTVGSSLIEFERNQLVTRRVDLRADHPDGFDDALAHEMTHIVVAERFCERQIPRWADEGMAVMADSATKQSLHARDFYLAHRQRETFRVLELLGMNNYPAASRQAVFYGQSASLVRFLVERGGHAAFLQFLEQASSSGYDAALQETYAIGGLPELERQWLGHVNDPQTQLAAQTARKQPQPSANIPAGSTIRPVAFTYPATAHGK